MGGENLRAAQAPFTEGDERGVRPALDVQEP